MSKPHGNKKTGREGPRFTDLSNPWQRFRAQTNMTQQQLADILEAGQTAVAQWESGRRTPSPWQAKRFLVLCKARKVRCSWDEIYEHVSLDG